MEILRRADAVSKVAVLPQENYVSFSNVVKASLLALLWTLLGMESLHSQVVWSDQAPFQVGYELIPSKSSYAAGEQITVRLHGDVDATNAGNGMEFLLDLHPGLVVEPVESNHLPASSWLGIPSELEINDSITHGNHLIQVFRPDSCLKSGNGAIVDVVCAVVNNGLNAGDVVSQLDGGSYVMIENIDMKTSLADPGLQKDRSGSLEVQTFPNPCTEWVAFKTSVLEPCQVSFYDMSGSLRKSSQASSEEQMNVESLGPGTYLMEIRTLNGRSIGRARFVKL